MAIIVDKSRMRPELIMVQKPWFQHAFSAEVVHRVEKKHGLAS